MLCVDAAEGTATPFTHIKPPRGGNLSMMIYQPRAGCLYTSFGKSEPRDLGCYEYALCGLCRGDSRSRGRNDAAAQGVAREAGRFVNLQFVHERLAVLFDGLDANAEGIGNLFVGFASGDEGKNFGFAMGKARHCAGLGLAFDVGSAIALQHAVRNRRTEEGVATMGLAHGLEQFGGGGFLHDVTCHAGLQRGIDFLRFAVAGENDDFGVGRLKSDLAGGVQAVHNGHGEIEEHDVGLELRCHAEGLLAIARFAGDSDVAFGFEQRFETLSDDAVIIDDQNGN